MSNNKDVEHNTITLCGDIYGIIFNFLNFKTQISYKRVCKKFNNFMITDLYNIEYECRFNLNNNILKQDHYSKIEQLDLSYAQRGSRYTNFYVSDLNFLTNLKKLNISNWMNVTTQIYDRIKNNMQYDVNKEIMKLNVYNNHLIDGGRHIFIITSGNHLGVIEECGLTGPVEFRYENIMNLKLEELIMVNQRYFVGPLNHIQTLTTLDVSGYCCRVHDSDIIGLKLRVLIAKDNIHLRNLNKITTLEKLDISGESNVGDEGIKGLKLIELIAKDNKNIKNLNDMATLKRIDVGGCCGVNLFGVYKLDLLNVNIISTGNLMMRLL